MPKIVAPSDKLTYKGIKEKFIVKQHEESYTDINDWIQSLINIISNKDKIIKELTEDKEAKNILEASK